MKKTLLLIVITFLASFSFSQKELAKKLIDTLASDAFYGRGYVNNGDKIAADYIAKKFKEFGALPVNGDSYFQEYSYPVNTFPTKVEVSFDNKTLTTGLDFIVAPNSGSAKGIFNLKEITLENYIEVVSKEEFQSDKNLTAFVIKLPKANGRDEYFKQLKLKNSVADVAPLFVINDEKFTWSVAQEALNYPVIEIKSEFLKDKKSVTLNIVNKLIADYQTQNVLGYIPAKRKCKRKKFFVFTAHYDHLGMMGETATFNGANDNASGIAMMLTLMKYFSENNPEYSVLFIAFGGEEAGLLGSKYYVENPIVPLNKMKFLYNVDMMGTGSEGIQVVNSTEHPKEFERLKAINKKYDLVKVIKPRGKAANSDHYWFEEAGVPSFFSYTLGGVTYYHDIQDRPETLPLTEFDDLHKLIVEFVNSF
ncbi:MAG: M28 family peptidase [Flavobacteriales bacterium]|jgi:aminopeptidase YwaD|tara:strand:+ start:1413 stop:2675 length:1263 start_codon:yes stop_codon:yes gene_type:complete